LDRMAACGAVGRGFESLWARIEDDLDPRVLYNYCLERTDAISLLV
jgi:hypothetical protein